MRPKACLIRNFGSYREIEFSFENLGLSLVSGPTGSGKSTLVDIIPWIAFGTTSKNGSVDEVRAWGCEEPTIGILTVETSTGDVKITRIRGKASQNDLYWTEAVDSEKEIRGKDITETQKLLNDRLGVDAELYALGAYFSQFSTGDTFFTMKPKDRREILERISDLSTAVTLAERSSEARKVAKKELESLEASHHRNAGRLEVLNTQFQHLKRMEKEWEEEQAETIRELKESAANFEAEKAEKYSHILARLEEIAAKIRSEDELQAEITKNVRKREILTNKRQDHQKLLPKVSDLRSRVASAQRDKERLERLSGSCPTCLGPTDNPNRGKHIAECDKSIADLTSALKSGELELSELEKALKSEYEVTRAIEKAQAAMHSNAQLLSRLESEQSALDALESAPNLHADRLEQALRAKNPYVAQRNGVQAELDSCQDAIGAQVAEITTKEHRIASLTSLYDLSFVLRGELLRASVSQLEKETNRRLEEYFDGVFRVKFELEDSDKLTVDITKDGFPCSFRQLSGGQRRMLTLSFSVALMDAAANKAGTSFSLLTFDEALNGLDDELKMRAYRLFEELESDHESIILIDHSEALKGLFANRFEISMQGENSVVRIVEEN